jgi:hypothetical protein
MAAMSEAVTDLKSPMDLRGQGVIVTGGNRGIGFGISTAFAQRGARVAILCRNGEDGRRAAAELMAQGYEAMAVECDIRSGESVCGGGDGVGGLRPRGRAGKQRRHFGEKTLP